VTNRLHGLIPLIMAVVTALPQAFHPWVGLTIIRFALIGVYLGVVLDVQHLRAVAEAAVTLNDALHRCLVRNDRPRRHY
jgi:hypothetical protein